MKTQTDRARRIPLGLALVASCCAWALCSTGALADEEETDSSADETEAAEDVANITVELADEDSEDSRDSTTSSASQPRPWRNQAPAPADGDPDRQDDQNHQDDRSGSSPEARPEPVEERWAISNSRQVPYNQRPETLPFYADEPMPEGYLFGTEPNYGLIAGGASVLGVLWLASTITAIKLDSEPAGGDDPNFDDMYWPMFIPVAGPFAAIGTADSSGTGAAILALDGVVQAAGLGMLIWGFMDEEPVLTKKHKYYIAPMAKQAGGGLTLGGRL